MDKVFIQNVVQNLCKSRVSSRSLSGRCSDRNIGVPLYILLTESKGLMYRAVKL